MVVDREERYRRALTGIASCGTVCICCEMHKGVAQRALGVDRVHPVIAALYWLATFLSRFLK